MGCEEITSVFLRKGVCNTFGSKTFAVSVSSMSRTQSQSWPQTDSEMGIDIKCTHGIQSWEGPG